MAIVGVGMGVLWGGVCVHLLCVVVVGFLLILPVDWLCEVGGAAGLPAAPCRACACDSKAGVAARKVSHSAPKQLCCCHWPDGSLRTDMHDWTL